MSKIISVIINFLNRINKIIWKIIIFLSRFIKVDDIKHLNDKPIDERYRLFKVDEAPIIEPFVKLEHKDHKQLIKDNNIKPVNRRNGKQITINLHCPCCIELFVIRIFPTALRRRDCPCPIRRADGC